MMRRLALVAALVLVAGIGLTAWLDRQNDVVPAVPAQTHGVPGQLVIGSPAPTPASDFSLMVDDSALVGQGPTAPDPDAQVNHIPATYFVHRGAIYVDDHSGGIVTYRDGRRVDSVRVPASSVRYTGIAVWQETYYLLTERLRAYVRQGDQLVETSLPDDLAGDTRFRGLVVEDGNLVAVEYSGTRRLVAGSGPLAPASAPSLTGDAVLIADGAVDARIALENEPVWAGLLGRDADHVWYQVCEAWLQGGDPQNQCYVIEFDDQGRHTASYTADNTRGLDFQRDLGVADGQVYQLVHTDRSILIRRLRPDPPRPGVEEPTGESQPDGKRFGIVRHFDGQAIYLDPAEWFSNEEASQAAEEDGEDLPNPFYLRNREDQVVRLPVSEQFTATVIDGSNYSEERVLSGADFAELYRPGAADAWMYSFPDRLPVHFEVVDAQVVGVVEQYVP